MINYILQKDLIQKDYVRLYTNASFIVNKDFKMPGELDGVFSGYDAKARKYDKAAWAFEIGADGVIKKDPTLKDPMCVYQLLKKHYSRYDLDTVSSITGTPKADLLKVYETYASTHAPDKVGTSMYAMGWTQHTVGTQNIRAMTIIQQLLGNMGMAGGGINALRGESNVQGSTDYGLLFHILPSYLPVPNASKDTLETYIKPYAAGDQGAAERELARELEQVLRQLPQGDLRRERDAGERVRLPVAAEARRRAERLLARDVRRDVQGRLQGLLRLGAEPGLLGLERRQGPQGAREAGVDGQRQPLRQRDRLVLARPRREPGGDQDRGLHAALRLLGREGGEHLQLGSLGPVALQGGRAPRARRAPTARSSTSWR